MQAIILAAGKGKRLAPLTDNTPKPLIPVHNKPILERLIESLPEEVREVFIIVDYRAQDIRDYFGTSFSGKKITYIQQGEMTGTYGAVYSAKKYLQPGKFLVVGSDDIFSKIDLQKLTDNTLAFGVHKKFLPGMEWLIIEEKNGAVSGMRRPTESEFSEEQYVATGAYVLDESFWKCTPVQLSGGEYGLPQTLREVLGKQIFSLVEMPDWLSINTHEDLAFAEAELAKKDI